MSEQELNLTPTRPYLARAIYEWICDNNFTPYMLVDATKPLMCAEKTGGFNLVN